MTTQRWLTIHTKPNAEGRAYIGIESSGWTVFAPFEMVRYIDRGLVCRKAISLFGPYLFVLVEPERMSQINGIDGVDCVIRDLNGKPRFVHEQKIEELRRARDMGAFDHTRGDWAKAGDEVKMADSALKGWVGKIKNAPRHKRIELVFDGAPFRVTTSIDKLEKVRA
jgi:transcription antitermination factor NusG